MTNDEANREIEEYLKRKEEEENRLKEALVYGNDDDAEPAKISTPLLYIMLVACFLSFLYSIYLIFNT